MTKQTFANYAVKIPTIASLSYAGATMLASNMSFLGDNAIPIGGAIGLGVGSVVAWAVTELGKANQAIPIVIIGYYLAQGGYKEGMKWVYENNLQHELSKEYYEYERLMLSKSRQVYDESAFNSKKENYLMNISIENKKIILSNKDKENFISNKSSWIDKKTDELLASKYKNGKRTRYYNNLISPYITIANEKNIILPPSGKIGTREDREAVRAVAEVMYIVALEKFSKTRKILTSSTQLKDLPFEVRELSEKYIAEKREEITNQIDLEINKAKANIPSLKKLEEQAWWAGFIAEVIIAPIFMWVNLLKRLPTFGREEKSFRRRTSKTDKFVHENRKNVNEEVSNFSNELNIFNSSSPLYKQRALYISLQFSEYLRNMMVFKTKKEGITSLQLFDSTKEKEEYIEAIKNGDNYKANSIKRTTVNQKLFNEIGGSFETMPDSIKKPWNDGIRFLKYLILNVEIPKNLRGEDLKMNILREYYIYSR